MYPNYLVLSHIAPFEPGLKSFLKESNEVKLFWDLVYNKLDKDRLKRRCIKAFKSPKLFEKKPEI